ncbi:MAG: hypothetical protein JJ895_00570 [Balneolaceae bacterium]|nr:hypothetical protein [Balneolaceae bacterium]
MFKFFRRIRQNLLSDNKITKYLIYAMGEIVLVVIGILIALQINNWNNEVEKRSEEQLIIQNLHIEFEKNKIGLQSYIEHHEQLLEATTQIMDLIGAPNEELDRYNLDSLIASSLDYIEFNPRQSVISDLNSSGRLNLISSDSLRLLIYEWSVLIEGAHEGYDTLDEINQMLYLPYLTKNASMKNIDQYGILEWDEKSKLYHNNYELFNDVEFENVVDNQAWDIKNYLNHLKVLEPIIDKIIQETEASTLN